MKTLPEGWPQYIAHRGASTLAPENSIPAFETARALGCQGFELDVHLCRSGELVVIHDSWLDRIAGVHLKVEELDLSDLDVFDTGSFFNGKFPELANPRWSSVRVPTLDSVFETVGPDMFLDIELKGDFAKTAIIARATNECIARHQRKNCIVSSFNPFALRCFARENKEGNIPLAAIYTEDSSVPWYLRHRECVYLSGAGIRKPSKVIALASRHSETGSSPVLVWTVDSTEEASVLLDAGVNSVITNRIQDFVQ
jgi:glycerophosphoryl diester phosphodiesterase